MLGGVDAARYVRRLTDWLSDLTRDCPRKHAPRLFDPCGAQMPDLLTLARRW
jgi:hypothetical protein